MQHRKEEKEFQNKKKDESIFKDNDILQAKQKELETQNLNNKEIKKQIEYIYATFENDPNYEKMI